MKILDYDPKKRKMVLCGELSDGTFLRTVGSKHFMRVIGGYGIQEGAFQEILEKGCKKIVIYEAHTKNYWESDISNWLEHCHIADYGNGKQRFLSLKYMHTHKI